MSEDDKEGKLSRWAARKRAVQSGDILDDAVEPSQVETVEEKLEAKAKELEANRLAAEAVDLENISQETDFKLFLKEGVPVLLRKKALSVLWRSNPVLANLDGLNDYDENFADPSLIMDKFDSAYQAGKGYLKKIVEEIDQAVEADQEELAEADADFDSALEETKETDTVTTETAKTEAAKADLTEVEQTIEGSSVELIDDTAEEVDELIAEAPKMSLRQRRQMMGEF